jgi:hypothetical protein
VLISTPYGAPSPVKKFTTFKWQEL